MRASGGSAWRSVLFGAELRGVDKWDATLLSLEPKLIKVSEGPVEMMESINSAGVWG